MKLNEWLLLFIYDNFFRWGEGRGRLFEGGAYSKFHIQQGRLIEGGRLFEEIRYVRFGKDKSIFNVFLSHILKVKK